jgi:hypothetical protein
MLLQMSLSPNPLIGHKSALQVATNRVFAGTWDWLTCSTATLGGGELQVLPLRFAMWASEFSWHTPLQHLYGCCNWARPPRWRLDREASPPCISRCCLMITARIPQPRRHPQSPATVPSETSTIRSYLLQHVVELIASLGVETECFYRRSSA